MSHFGTCDEIDDRIIAIKRPRPLHMPEEFRELLVDVHMWDSIINYVWFGLHPGSYGERLLLHDYDGALRRAHEVIREWKRHLQDDVTANMILLIQALPDVCHGDPQRFHNWQINGGLEGQPKMRVLFRLAL